MSTIIDIIKLSVIMCVAGLLFYVVFPKYKFMGPNDFAVYRCNIVTGEVMGWDIGKKTWVTPSRKTMAQFLNFRMD